MTRTGTRLFGVQGFAGGALEPLVTITRLRVPAVTDQHGTPAPRVGLAAWTSRAERSLWLAVRLPAAEMLVWAEPDVRLSVPEVASIDPLW